MVTLLKDVEIMKNSIAKALFKSHSYLEYRKLVSDLLKLDKVTGNEQSQDLTLDTILNETRMDQIGKTLQLAEETVLKLRSLKHEYVWIVIAEGWSHDAAELLPIFDKMAFASQGKIEMQIVFRHENEELMQFFLTNKTKAIPKLIVIHRKSGDALAHWGPRPKEAADLFNEYQRKYHVIDEKLKTEMQLWYLHDKGMTTQGEIVDMMLDLDQEIVRNE